MTKVFEFLEWRGFDWDERSRAINGEKHRFSATAYEQVFFNSPLVTGQDEKHSNRELRYYALGITDAKRKLFIVFTVRNKFIRVIYARDMSRKERKVFDKP